MSQGKLLRLVSLCGICWIGNGFVPRSTHNPSRPSFVIHSEEQGHLSVEYFDMAHNKLNGEDIQDKGEQRFWNAFDFSVRLVPIVNPIVAYFTYEELAQAVSNLFELLSDNSWVAVDGGAYQAKVIAPAINGVVVPALSILFATLVSNTVSILRQRLLDIRTSINLEAGDLRFLQTMVDAFPSGTDQMMCRSYIIQYISRLIAESQPGVNISQLEPTGLDSEMNGMMAQLIQCELSGHISSSLLAESRAVVTRLSTHRSERISALQATFPPLHYAVVSALALSVCGVFLMETNQDLLIFLNSIQLRILWTMLIGTFSALAVTCYDLRDPFGGSNQVKKSVDQLFTIRDAVIASSALADSHRTERAKKKRPQRKTRAKTKTKKANANKKTLAAKETL